MGGLEVSLHAFFTLPLDGGEWSTSPPGHSTPGERTLLPIEKEVGWSTEQIWTFSRRGNCSLNKQVQAERTVYLHVFQFSIHTVVAVLTFSGMILHGLCPPYCFHQLTKGDIWDMFIIYKV